MRHFLTPSIIAVTLMITGCASVSESIPTVKVVRKKPQTVATVMSQYQQAFPTVQRAEAPMVCDNDNMRARAADNNAKNDTARVLILEDNDRSNTVLADVTVNCKDYFENRGQWAGYAQSQPQAPVFGAPMTPQTVSTTPTQAQIDTIQAPQVVRPQTIKASTVTNIATNQRMYRIRTGDNLYRIARNNCTDAETLAQMNNIYDASRISPGQMIRLPKGCK
ncbi:LysM peptidoglycan-binding domain-containing protein [Fretibacter rubidus]|uniref:LysM peptidoglycan-binding domain-containing protein n=1 Tax=Fretibacter rubidus TaxID=570162 RepID=UPI00352A788E